MTSVFGRFNDKWSNVESARIHRHLKKNSLLIHKNTSMLITGTFSRVYAISLHILSASHSHKKEMSSLYSVSHVTLRTLYTVPTLSLYFTTAVTGALQHRKPGICLLSPCSAT